VKTVLCSLLILQAKCSAQACQPSSWTTRVLSLREYALIINLHMELHSIWTGFGSHPGSLRTV